MILPLLPVLGWMIFWAIMATGTSIAQVTTNSSKHAVLIADRIAILSDNELVAEGHVEVFHGKRKLTARRITYNTERHNLMIDGPIYLTDNHSTRILANSAMLDRNIQDGLMTGAKLILGQHIQLATIQLERSKGQYSTLHNAVATSCRICEEGDAPLWQIRARRVVHDQANRQLHFEGARLLIMDVPVLYLPRLRLPEPALERASGFLIPSLRTTTQLSTGIRIPYFQEFGDHADLTVSPYLSSRTSTINLTYQHAFSRGRLAFEGGFTRDDLIPGLNRGYVFGAGGFAFDNGHELYFDVEWASEEAYLHDYNLPNKDRLDSEIAFTRTGSTSYYRAGFIHFQSLREGEIETEIPTLVTEFDAYHRYTPQNIGGEIRLVLATQAYRRSSPLDEKGRDIARTSIDSVWQDNTIFASGLRTDWQLGLVADAYRVRQDRRFPSTLTRTTPYAALTLRFPLTRVRNHTIHFIEPVAQIGWSHASNDIILGSQTNSIEFDEGNLLSLSRFPEPIARQDGTAFAYGGTWRNLTQTREINLTLGQVIFSKDQNGFSRTSGLSGNISDILIAGQYKNMRNFDLTARAILARNVRVSKSEFRANWYEKSFDLGGAYIFLRTDPTENRSNTISEVKMDASFDITPYWILATDWQYNVTNRRASKTGVGLTYVNECVEIDFSIERRNTSSTHIEPLTEFRFNIVLHGFSTNSKEEEQVRSCKG